VAWRKNHTFHAMWKTASPADRTTSGSAQNCSRTAATEQPGGRRSRARGSDHVVGAEYTRTGPTR